MKQVRKDEAQLLLDESRALLRDVLDTATDEDRQFAFTGLLRILPRNIFVVDVRDG